MLSYFVGFEINPRRARTRESRGIDPSERRASFRGVILIEIIVAEGFSGQFYNALIIKKIIMYRICVSVKL